MSNVNGQVAKQQQATIFGILFELLPLVGKEKLFKLYLSNTGCVFCLGNIQSTCRSVSEWLGPLPPRQIPVIIFQCCEEGVIIQPVGILGEKGIHYLCKCSIFCYMAPESIRSLTACLLRSELSIYDSLTRVFAKPSPADAVAKIKKLRVSC